MSKRDRITVGITLGVVAVIFCFIPLKAVAYTVIVDYQDVETYYVDEPYEDTETYYEEEPYEDVETYRVPHREVTTEKYYISVWPSDWEVLEAISRYETAYVTLKNTSNIAGTFIVSFSFSVTSLRRDWYDGHLYIETNNSEDEQEIYLKLGERGTVTSRAKYYDETSSLTWSYAVFPEKEQVEMERMVPGPIEWVEEQRTVTKYRQVEKQRTVTKYKQVEKQRTVTKQREELKNKKVTLLDYFLHY